MVHQAQTVHGRTRLLLLFVIVLLFGSASTIQAANVTATWNPNTESNIAGYKLSYGTQTGVYSTTVDTGNVTTWSLTLTAGQTYFFALQAYNTSGLTSPLSAEVVYVVPAPTTPTITSLAPTSGPVGTTVTVLGTNFGATKGTSTVAFNGTIATPTIWSATSINVPVPAGATTGRLIITVGGVASIGLTFTVVTPTPSITSLAPVSGPVGRLVTVAGTNFGAIKGASTVAFNGTAATPTTWSATSIVVPVPAGATTGSVVVTVGGAASPGVAFTVMPTPTVTSLAPSSGPVGTAVTISGTNFSASEGTSAVTVNSTSATPTNWSATSIVVPVPAGATTGNVIVTVGGVASVGVTFIVTPTATARAQVTTPAPESTLTASTVTVEWTGGTGVSQYWLYVGTTPGGSDLFGQNRGTSLSATLPGLPTDGSTLYVRLWSLIGGTWQYNEDN